MVTQGGRRGLGLRRLLGMMLVMFGLGASAYGGWQVASEFGQVGAYDDLRRETHRASGYTVTVGEPAAEEEPAGIDWETLLATNGDVAAWMRVDGTSVDYPVCQASEGDPDWYLHHDLWGEWSKAGCLYVDWRTSADATHLLVYGHHLPIAGGMLTDVSGWWQQDELDAHADAVLTWETPDGEVLEMVPLCATSVWEGYETVQKVGDMPTDSLRELLRQLVSEADAVVGGAGTIVEGAGRAVTLVTCTQGLVNEGARTCVTFVCPGSDEGADAETNGDSVVTDEMENPDDATADGTDEVMYYETDGWE